MSSVAIKPEEFVGGNLSVKQLKMLDNGAKMVNLEYATPGGQTRYGVQVQTPVVTLPYGMNTFDKDGKNPKYSVDLSFRDAETDPKMKAFYEFAQAFDARMIKLAMENAQSWFKLANPSVEVIKAFYTPMVKIPLDKEGRVKPYPPTTKVSLKQKDGVFTTHFYDKAKKRYEGVPVEELLVRGTKMRCIIQCTGIWIAGSKFGPSWKAEQICVESLPERIRGYGFRDDEEESAPALSNRANTGGAGGGSNRFSNLVEDDDEEESAASGMMPRQNSVAEDDEEDEVVEAVPPPPKKTQPVAAGQPKKAGPKKVPSSTK